MLCDNDPNGKNELEEIIVIDKLIKQIAYIDKNLESNCLKALIIYRLLKNYDNDIVDKIMFYIDQNGHLKYLLNLVESINNGNNGNGHKYFK
ncbi:hypothetical protein ACPB8Q_02215 [Methanocaldococcus indicus]|uniref:hypothetical protein n=1 Tax=Methanocaldococcus indicus TaxID=213231 RepID=UPI003C6D94D2